MEQAIGNGQDELAGGRRVFWLAGLGMLLSGFLLLAAFHVPDVETSQRIIFTISPLALLPAIAALYSIFRRAAPDLSRLGLLVGMVGMLPVLIELFVSGVLYVTGAAGLGAGWPARLQTFLAGFTILVGLWMAIAGQLGLSTRQMPPGLGAAGLAAGLARILITSNILLGSLSAFPQNAISGLWNLALVAWILTHLLFSAWLGIWLFTRKAPLL